MPKCDFNKVGLKFALYLYRNHTSAWVFSGKFAAYFQNTFSLEHLWVATLPILYFIAQSYFTKHSVPSLV